MMKSTQFCALLVMLLTLVACKESVTQNEPSTKEISEGTRLLNEMVNTLGGIEKYRQLRDVTFTYVYRDTSKNAQDISIEKYIYDGELSRGEYSEHTKTLMKNSPPSNFIQGWNGKISWMTEKGKLITDTSTLGMVKFSRNTTFFWFNMMYKLLDPGTIHTLLPNRTYKGKKYQIVEVTYGENIGDAQDRLILYINPATKLVDNFLFVNTFMGETTPRMMEVRDYKDYNGLKFQSYMRYEPADWEGNILDGVQRAEKFYTNVQFNTDIEKSLFEKPEL